MDIAATLQRLCLQPTTQPHLHVLFMEYPATNLLPNRPGIGLRMEPPKAALYREQPNVDKYFLREHGLEYAVRFPVSLSRPTEARGHSPAGIATAIDRLSQSGGRSTLEAVTVSFGDCGESGYIFRLTTFWRETSQTEVHDFNVSEREWQDLLSLSDLKPWTDLLLDLFSRASDRAYLHVERQLKGTEHFAIDALKWNAYQISTANQLLALNMREVRQLGTLFCLEPIRDLSGDGHRVFTVRLPCEHESTVSIDYLKTLPLASCIDLACPMCGHTILPDRDVVHAQHSTERRRRQRKALDQIMWKRVENGPTRSKPRVETSGAIICLALAHALESMQVPTSVSPRQLCPAWSVEAAAILAKTRKAYAHLTTFFTATPSGIQTQLSRVVDLALLDCCGLRDAEMSDQVFPGWSAFVSTWLDRTVGILTVPNYFGEDVWTIWCEVPDEDICFDNEGGVLLGGGVDLGGLMEGVSL